MRLFVVLGILLSAVELAWGADLPTAPTPAAPAVYAPAPVAVYNWSGFYVGANAGWGFANATPQPSLAAR